MSQQCTATSKQTGNQCRNTAVPGLTVCRIHGGSTARAKAAAARNLETQRARDAANQLGLPLSVSPQQALLDEVQRAAGMVAYYGQKVAELAEDDPNKLVHGVTKVEQREGFQAGTVRVAEPAVNVWLKLWNEERDRLARAASAALKAGIEERRVQLAEAQGALIADVIRRILGRLNLNHDQITLVGTVVPEELRALTATAEGNQL